MFQAKTKPFHKLLTMPQLNWKEIVVNTSAFASLWTPLPPTWDASNPPAPTVRRNSFVFEYLLTTRVISIYLQLSSIFVVIIECRRVQKQWKSLKYAAMPKSQTISQWDQTVLCSFRITNTNWIAWMSHLRAELALPRSLCLLSHEATAWQH